MGRGRGECVHMLYHGPTEPVKAWEREYGREHREVGITLNNLANKYLDLDDAGRARELPWIIGGDWQDPPIELARTGFLDLVGGTIATPHLTTCNRRAIDFFVVADSLSHAIYDVAVIDNP